MESRESGYRNIWNDSGVNLPEEDASGHTTPANGGWPTRYDNNKFPFPANGNPSVVTPGDKTPKEHPRASFDSGRPTTSHSFSGYPAPIGPPQTKAHHQHASKHAMHYNPAGNGSSPHLNLPIR